MRVSHKPCDCPDGPPGHFHNTYLFTACEDPCAEERLHVHQSDLEAYGLTFDGTVLP